MRFGVPFNFWLLWLLPLLTFFSVWAIVRKRQALEQFASRAMVVRLTQEVSQGRQYSRYVLQLVGFLFLVLALTAPQFGTKLAMARQRGVDVMVVLDVSRSMLAEDSKPSRLAQARFQIGQLLNRLQGDRVGLVVFAGHAFIQCPLTLDYGAVRLFLDILDASTVLAQGTAIGEAIRLAAQTFVKSEGQDKVMVLFTDGEDHDTAPVKAAQRAAAEGIRLFAIGMGTPEGELIPEREAGSANYHRDAQGNPVLTRLDEETLEKIALAGQGVYFRSTLGGSELDALCKQIAGMDQKEVGSTRFIQYEDRFQIPLLLALICFFAAAGISERRHQSTEWRGRFA